MKLCPLSALLGLLLASLAPAADLIFEGESLDPKSTLELRFDTPMIPKERVGTVEKSLPLVVKPAIEGEFKWTSTRSGQFTFTKTPALGTAYEFSLRKGLKDAAGKAVEVEEWEAFHTEAFRVVDDYKEYPYSYGDSARRVPYFMLQFSDAVDAAAAAKQFHFKSRFGNTTVPATARLATGKDFKKRYSTEYAPTWDEQAAGVKVGKLKDDETRPNALIVQSAEPLPAGVDWTLVIPASFANSGATAKMESEVTFEWGSVQVLKINKVEAESHFDGPHTIRVEFNKTVRNGDLSEQDLQKAAAQAASFVTVTPDVPGKQVTLEWSVLSIDGDFALNTPYTVSVNAGLPGADGLTLEQPVQNKVTFTPSPVFVSTTASANGQMAKGKGVFDVYAANYKELRVRVKQLSDADLIKARGIHDDEYEGFDHDEKNKKPARERLTSFEQFPGKPVFEKVFKNEKPLERGGLLTLNWKDVLGQTPAAPLFVDIEAVSQDGAPAGTILNRGIVEFTDIGLIAKDTGKEALVYAFSLQTGEPLAGTQLTLADDERNNVGAAQTDAQGIARVPAEGAAWVLAKRGDDCTAMSIEGRDSRIGLWGQGINIGWESPWKTRHETFLFSDRPVYKPGETAHVKAISRLRTGDELALGAKPFTAELTLSDPRGREILTKNVTFTANGTWAGDIDFPDAAVGWYDLRLAFPKDGKAKDEEENDSANLANLAMRVDEYKTNTFEVMLDGAKFKAQRDRVTVPLKANYYMGKALSQAKATWSASLNEEYMPPEQFAQFHFGDVPKWWHYGEDRDDETATNEEDRESWGAHGELTLAEDGTATIDLPPPPPQKQALPQTVSIYADVTDVNQQTISANTEFTLPGADFVVGAKSGSWYGTAGKPLGFDFVAITSEGNAFTAPVPVSIKVERQEWNSVRVQSAGNAVTTKNQAVLTEVAKGSVQLKSTNNLPSSGEFSFTPKAGGTYFLTATATDTNGKTVLSRVAFYVLGGKSYPWAWEDGARITLQPDKTKVKPGEEVSVVVKSPIAGNALVTVERNRIHRQFMAPVSPENPVVKVKLTEEEAPNAFISVVVVRGAAKSQQPDPMPEYRVGYCEIQVESDARKLFVTAEPTLDTVRPGEEETVSAIVKDSAGRPVAGSEVTLFAADEGVLSLMDYETPQPLEFFQMPVPLAVNNYTTLDALLNEDMAKRYRGNKGIVVGDAEKGEDGAMPPDLRKNFVATAVWSAALVTDAQGRVSTTFKAPDSLTRYRLMAVAVKDADKFGTGVSAFVVNKPLMVEPVVPRFAHVGDELLVKGVVHNTTANSGEVEVELKLDGSAVLITEQRPFALIGLKNRTTTNDGRSERRVIPLKAGETTALAFPVRFVKPGTSAWQWRVKTTKWSDAKALSDAVESKFEVTPPAPSLREVHYFALTSASAKDNLLKGVNPQLLEADGELRLDFSQSRMSEARDALEFLLHYPYGCVEQTTSNMLPWLALSKYDAMFPDLLEKGKVQAAIHRGADRLLQMQTNDGGLAYWPGGDTAELWASAYGGFGLIKAKEWGIAVPQQSVDKLTEWISKQLRELDLAKNQKTYDLCDAALALYTLAKAGKPEPAYADLLYARREKLPEISRLFLALSMCIQNAPEKQITELLKPQKNDSKWQRYWLGPNTAAGLRLIVDAHLGLTKEANMTADELLKRRGTYGHWGTTFSNAWVLLGLSTNERAPKDAKPVDFVLNYGGTPSPMSLSTPLASTGAMFNFAAKAGAPVVNLALPEGQTMRGRVSVKAWPDMKTFQPVQKGFGIKRTYERLTPTGLVEPAENLRVGDLIVVTLEINVLKGNRYLAIEDPLPSVFEPVNPEFTTQNAKGDAAGGNAWTCDHTELRDDRALFFTNDWSELGKFELKYLARVIAEGDVIAPPARIEAMYEPDHYGLSAIQRVQTLPMSDGRDVAGK